MITSVKTKQSASSSNGRNTLKRTAVEHIKNSHSTKKIKLIDSKSVSMCAFDYGKFCSGENEFSAILSRLNYFIPNYSEDSGVDPIKTEVFSKMKNTGNDEKFRVMASSSSSKSPSQPIEPLQKNVRIKSNRKPSKLHQCDQCDYSTKIKCSYEQHLITHMVEKSHACTYCPKKFKRLDNLTHHKRKHVAKFPAHCSICLKEFSTKDAANEHQRDCKVKRYECYACKLHVQHRNWLVQHFRKHSGIRVSCTYKGCERTFANKLSLYRHLKSYPHKIEL